MHDIDPRSDAELLAATPADPDAYAIFYRRHVRALLSVVVRRAAADDVGDIVAEVFASALAARRRYDPARGTAGAWLTAIALHKVADANRRGAAQARICRRLGMQVPALPAAELTADPWTSEVLAGLPADQRRAVEARVLLDRSYEQIAREEAVSSQVVRKRVSRALGSLRSRLGEER